MKKILVIHNKYRNIGGEDVAVAKEIELLKNYYHVETIYYSNDIKNYIMQVISFFSNRNFNSTRRLKTIIHEFNPDFAYVHNTWFNASLGIFKVLDHYGIKTILKLHNFRYDCTKSFFSSKHFGKKDICHGCGLKKSEVGLFNKYFHDSYLKSLLVSRYGKKYFDILQNNNLRVLVLTKFHKEYLINLGLSEKNINIYPNYLDLENINRESSPDKYIIYAGRISEEKGVEELIKSFIKCNLNDLKLKIIGEGPLLEYLKDNYVNQNIIFLGIKSNKEVLEIMKKSIGVVTATKLYEGQPMLLCEASSLGVPSVFPDSGGILEFFPKNYQLFFKQFNYLELMNKIKLISDSEISKSKGEENKKYIKTYLNKEKLIEKFEEVLNDV